MRLITVAGIGQMSRPRDVAAGPSGNSPMDALSDVLRVVRLSGAVFIRAEFTEPWCVFSQLAPSDCAAHLATPEELILYHYVVQGRLKVRVGDAPDISLGPGEIVILPHNDEHIMGSDLALYPVPSHEVISPSLDGDLATIRYGGGGPQTTVICGYLGSDSIGNNPLTATLPPTLQFDTRQGPAADLIRASFQFAAQEGISGRIGSATILSKLSELLFVDAVRRHVESLPQGQTGWLAGLKDPYVSRALTAVHARTAEPWTVDALASEAGLSRSAFADRFTELIGRPPMQYLAWWRMQIAAEWLRRSQMPLARVATEVGYDSEPGFSRAFKRAFGVPPAEWRRHTGQADFHGSARTNHPGDTERHDPSGSVHPANLRTP